MPHSHKVAIVDDDALVRNGIGSLLRSAEYEAVVFESAEKFLASDPKAFACVISDIQMPEIDGLALQRELKVEVPDLPIIFLTAFPDDAARKKAIDEGAVGFLEKPCDPNELIDILGRAVLSKIIHSRTATVPT